MENMDQPLPGAKARIAARTVLHGKRRPVNSPGVLPPGLLVSHRGLLAKVYDVIPVIWQRGSARRFGLILRAGRLANVNAWRSRIFYHAIEITGTAC